MLPLYSDVRRRAFPGYTVAIIALNLLLFAAWQERVGLSASVHEAGLVPSELLHGDQQQGFLHLLTYMFMHGGWMHLIGNMWFLWISAKSVEDAIGSGRFLAFYLICGVAAAYGARVLLAREPRSAGRRQRGDQRGARGVSAALPARPGHDPGAAVHHHADHGGAGGVVPAGLDRTPGVQVYTQAAVSAIPRQSSGVAYLAHIGGFVAGIVLLPFFRLGLPARESVD